MELYPGQRITAPFLSAPAEVKTFSQRSGYALIEVVLEDEHYTFQSMRVFPDQLAQIEILNEMALTRVERIEDFFDYIEVRVRARTSVTHISANEWKKVRYFDDDFWLYIVVGAKTEGPDSEPCRAVQDSGGYSGDGISCRKVRV